MKTNFGFTLIALVLTTILIQSCAKENASDVNQDKLYQYYEVFYNKNTDKTWVVARFNFGGPTGTILELDSGATVKFNNDVLPYNAVFAGHFKEFAGRITSGSFLYTNINNQTFTNSLPQVDTLAYQVDFDTLDKSQANTITWTGSPLLAHEAVGVFIGGWTWGEDALAYQEGDGATNLVLGITQLSTLPLGPATVYMDRAVTKNLTQATSKGGVIVAKYRCNNRVIQVVP